MKKLVLGAAIAMSSLTFAQSIGIKGGMNLSTLSDSDNLLGDNTNGVDSKSKVGFYGGLFANFPVAANFSIQPEVLYNNVGTKITGDDEVGNEGSIRLNLDYISVPVMFQYNATPSFYLEAGPQFGFLINSNLKAEVNGDTQTEDIDTDNFNTFDVGVGLGAGYWITPKFGINARYVAGISDVAKDNNTDYNFRNNNFQVGLAYKFK